MDRSIRDEAMKRVIAHYEMVASMAVIEIATINEGRPEHLRYMRRVDLVREWLAVAGAVASFAVDLGLLTPAAAASILNDFCHKHPDICEGLDQLGADGERDGSESV